MPLGLRAHLILMAVLTKPHVLCRCLDFQFQPIGLALSCCLSSSIAKMGTPGMGRISLMVSPPDFITGSYLIDSLLTANWRAAHSAFAHLILPVVCLAIVSAAPIIKQTRAIALEVIASDSVRYARACGLKTKTVRDIVFRNSATQLLLLWEQKLLD